MTDKEFEEMLEKLWDLGLNDGDLGFKYWSKVVFELKEMKKGNDFSLSLKEKCSTQ